MSMDLGLNDIRRLESMVEDLDRKLQDMTLDFEAKIRNLEGDLRRQENRMYDIEDRIPL